jgi:RNA recognition motif-containing protein
LPWRQGRIREMSNNIYVGNLPWSYKDDELKGLFEEHGEVTSAKVIVDRESGRGRGFGFVEMASADEAGTAIEALNGYEADGRELKVNEAKPRDD